MTGLRIALIGYGKMGKTIQKIAESKGHSIALIIDVDQANSIEDLSDSVDVAIEFTRPEAAVANITACIRKSIPVVSGTTGWLDSYPDVKALCAEKESAFFYASNYSIGVNIFFALNRQLAKVMERFPAYDISMTEIHHTQKLDAPSGTAITLAEGILDEVSRKTAWVNRPVEEKDSLGITSQRVDDVPGTHQIAYSSEIDNIEIVHTAHSRAGFASGALAAAEWLVGKKGCFGMQDMLKF
jgi:4-hydroxy-tetrahydrodipicolinate reductase